MKRRWLVVAVVSALYLLHNDLWWWRDADLVLGLPIGLAYHLGFCFLVALAMAWLVGVAWPAGLEEGQEDRGPGVTGSGSQSDRGSRPEASR